MLQVYRCDGCGKEFDDASVCVSHERQCTSLSVVEARATVYKLSVTIDDDGELSLLSTNHSIPVYHYKDNPTELHLCSDLLDSPGAGYRNAGTAEADGDLSYKYVRLQGVDETLTNDIQKQMKILLKEKLSRMLDYLPEFIEKLKED